MAALASDATERERDSHRRDPTPQSEPLTHTRDGIRIMMMAWLGEGERLRHFGFA